MLPGSELTQEPRFRQRIGRSSVKDRGELLNDHGLEVGRSDPKKNRGCGGSILGHLHSICDVHVYIYM